MLIPSIDLMDGKIVQLVQGKTKALEFENYEEWVERFASFPLVQLIDLDAAMERSPNTNLIKFFVQRLPCQVGGGMRTIEQAQNTLALGAGRVIVGSRLIHNGRIDTVFAEEAAVKLGAGQLVFAIDSKGGKVAVRGWREITTITPVEMIASLDPFCCAFLYTHIDTEGLMTGIPLDPVRALRQATRKQLIAAGGISTHHEIEKLEQMGVDAVVGMALYSGHLSLPDTIPISQ